MAAVVALVAGAVSRRAPTSIALGAMMLAFATHQAPDTRALFEDRGPPESWPRFDLTTAPLPADAKGFVRVRGFLRPELQLREFQVQEGERPDQNTTAHAVLMPLVNTEEGTIEVSGRVIIARVTERERLLPSLEEVRGELVAPPDGVSEILVPTAGPETAREVDVVMLDATRSPFDDPPWVTAIIVLILIGSSAAQLWPGRAGEDA